MAIELINGDPANLVAVDVSSMPDSDGGFCLPILWLSLSLLCLTVMIVSVLCAGTHGEVLHAGTVNMSDATRYFISIFLTAHGLPHRDSFATPQVQCSDPLHMIGVRDLQQ